MLAVKPGGDNGGNEKLRAVAVETDQLLNQNKFACIINLRVGARVSHGKEERLAVLQLKVLVGEFLAIDGATTGALERECQPSKHVLYRSHVIRILHSHE